MIIIDRWKNNWRNMLKDGFSFLGIAFFAIELADYFFPTFFEIINISSYGVLIIIISLVIGIIKNYPKNSFKVKIRDRDSYIKLKIGDAFKNDGALIVPINDYFDITLKGNVNKSKSIQKKLLDEYYESLPDHLISDITNTLDLTESPFTAGTTVEIDKKEKRFYLLVNSQKQENNRVKSTLDDFMDALNGIWEFLAFNSSRDDSVTIPLINTQHGRNASLTRSVVIKRIIDTFIDTTKYKSVCEELVISIHPADISKGELDFEELSEYLLFQCNNYSDITFDEKPEGKEIEPSKISEIST